VGNGGDSDGEQHAGEHLRRIRDRKDWSQKFTKAQIAISFLPRRPGPDSSDLTPYMPRTVNARIPLSLLEAIRRIDAPGDQGETEYVAELRNKRFGLSDTVYTQIRRYNDAHKRGQQIPFAEAEGLGTLIGRRPDADDLFRNAGSLLAEDIYSSISSTTRRTLRTFPGFITRPMALRQLRTIAGKFLGGSLERTGSFLTLRIPDSVTVNGSPNSAGCVYYETALRELLRLLTGNQGAVTHTNCVQRGEGACEWKAEWRT
jgi:predicted hydrocarbon binding protein